MVQAMLAQLAFTCLATSIRVTLWTESPVVTSRYKHSRHIIDRVTSRHVSLQALASHYGQSHQSSRLATSIRVTLWTESPVVTSRYKH